MSTPDTPVNPWANLDTELDAWVSEGRCANLWWRDDDAVAAGPKLARLVNMCSATGLLLAVIPAPMKDTLVAALSTASHVRVAQHGYAHINHAERGTGQGAWELGLHRGEKAVLADLQLGRELLEDRFESCFLPVLVPPWNHLAPELLPVLAARGYCAVSAFGPRAQVSPVPGLFVVNAHCDPIRWRKPAGARFAGTTKTILQLVEHLTMRRTGLADAAEPTGFVTHHIELSDEGWAFCERLARTIEEHAGARWLATEDVFAVVP